MSNYATKADSIKAIRIETSDLVLKPIVAKLRAEVDNIDVDKDCSCWIMKLLKKLSMIN